MNDDSPDAFLPLTPAVFHVLLSLAGGERHGYAIMRDIADSTQGLVRMGPGTLYGTIKRLLALGWIMETDERPDPALDDERRRYYRITELGRSVAAAEAKRCEQLARMAHRKLLIKPALGRGL
jgi:DNA-binding PadR family transcriptional regulator